jgi:hypothetical protein
MTLRTATFRILRPRQLQLFIRPKSKSIRFSTTEMTDKPQKEDQTRSDQRTATLRVRALLSQAQGDAGWDAAWQVLTII